MPSDRYRAHEPGKDSRRAYLVFAIGTFAYFSAVAQRTSFGVASVDAAERFDEAQRYVVERVQERPVQSTAIALGVGVVLGMLLAGRRR